VGARRTASELFDACQHDILARDAQRLQLREKRICGVVVDPAEDE
jgi:hypothetical protein